MAPGFGHNVHHYDAVKGPTGPLFLALALGAVRIVTTESTALGSEPQQALAIFELPLATLKASPSQGGKCAMLGKKEVQAGLAPFVQRDR